MSDFLELLPFPSTVRVRLAWLSIDILSPPQVRLVRKKDTGVTWALKSMTKDAMVMKNQVGKGTRKKTRNSF